MPVFRRCQRLAGAITDAEMTALARRDDEADASAFMGFL